MKLIEELADAFLFNSMETRNVLNIKTGEILLDAPEALTGEPEIDWESDEAENFIIIPEITSSEAYDIRVLFSEEQNAESGAILLEALNIRKPFRNFKFQLAQLDLEEEWYGYEYQYALNRMAEWLDKWKDY
ncbi:UPF0158 family protein [Lacicoccus qingdaonensis]|uniref:Uncharacterized protein family (UPF0158) n=1 Tax=Lacicoccus qingdaonensis TaxID=576118 RepID=A0A1G9IQI3_9BACL|nr:UPF0158 family protein [Salinicoccus qingdaonensis]SDL27417.1 Uncharacterised protein family (UPF0158) [Salinicoccus qingdaonensis]